MGEKLLGAMERSGGLCLSHLQCPSEFLRVGIGNKDLESMALAEKLNKGWNETDNEATVKL